MSLVKVFQLKIEARLADRQKNTDYQETSYTLEPRYHGLTLLLSPISDGKNNSKL